MISHSFSFCPNRGQLAPVDFYSQGFNLSFDDHSNATALTIWAAPQIAIHGRSKQPAKYPPKNTDEKKGYQTDWEQIS